MVALRWTLLALLCACGCKTGPALGVKADDSHRTETPDQRFAREADGFYWATMAAHPTWAAHLGYHQHDGALPDVTAAALRARAQHLEAALRGFTEISADQLSRGHQVEREVVLAYIRSERYQLDVAREPWTNPLYYTSIVDLGGYVSRDYAPLPERARALVRLCGAAGEFFRHAQANLASAMPRIWIDTALLQINGSIEFIETDVVKAVSPLAAAERQAVVAGLGRCVVAFSEFRAFLSERLTGANDQFALGEEKFVRMVADKEGLEITLERLQDIGQRDLARNQTAIEVAAQAIDRARPVAEVVAEVARERPSIDGVIPAAVAQSAQMRQFVTDHRLVSIPADDQPQIRESPGFLRWNRAFLRLTGPFESKPLPSFYYITAPDPSWPQAEQDRYVPFVHHLLFMTIHEVWPGRFLHALHLRTLPSVILKSFCTGSTIDGWAHYAEEMMWDAGVGSGRPEVHIGFLTSALLHNVRYLSAIGLHTATMSLDQAMTAFAERAFADLGTARQQAVRGTFDPGYLRDTLGKLMIAKLQADRRAKVGARYTPQRFHDELLSYGCAPLPVIRRFMIGPQAGPAL
jgi:uncharacterized protein (DUF885 family)